MAIKLTIQKPGLLKKAKEAKRHLANLAAQLAGTAGSHATASSALATARSNVDTLIAAIEAL
jgi:cell division septum initiation protein DivIVA